MNMFARFDENPAMTLQDIKETKRYGQTDGRTHGPTHTHTHARTDNVKTVYPPQTKFAGGIKNTLKKVSKMLPLVPAWAMNPKVLITERKAVINSTYVQNQMITEKILMIKIILKCLDLAPTLGN